MTVTLTKPDTQVVWRSTDPGVKNNSLPDPSLFDGYTLDIKTTEGDGSQYIVTPEAGTIGGLPAIAFFDRKCNLFLRADAKTRDWVIRCLCCLQQSQGVRFSTPESVAFQGNFPSVVAFVDNPPNPSWYWLQKASQLSGIFNTSLGTFSLWYRYGNPVLSQPLPLLEISTLYADQATISGSSGPLRILIVSSLNPFPPPTILVRFQIQLAEQAINTDPDAIIATFDNIPGNVSGNYPDLFYPTSDGWLHFLCSWNTNFSAGSRIVQLYVNDIPYTYTTFGDPFNDRGGPFAGNYTSTIDASSMSNNWSVATRSGPVLPARTQGGEVYDLWFDQSFLDLSITANRRKFIGFPSDLVPALTQPIDLPNTLFAMDLGTNGDRPLSRLPTIFLHKDIFSSNVNDYFNNRGFGGGFSLFGLGPQPPLEFGSGTTPTPVAPLPPR